MTYRWSAPFTIGAGIFFFCACSIPPLFGSSPAPATSSSSEGCNASADTACKADNDCAEYGGGIFSSAACFAPGTCVNGSCQLGAGLTSPRSLGDASAALTCNRAACNGGDLYYTTDPDGETCTTSSGLAGTCADGNCVEPTADGGATLATDAASDGAVDAMNATDASDDATAD